ncbi:MAG: methyltransferase [Hyphomicrobium sp.]|nr:methyltransferase [Hyphomicrobium sp.]
MTSVAPAMKLSEDAFLGDRLRIIQPADGYRAGVDAVLLAAAAPASAKGERPAQYADCGAGVGTVGLCVAARIPSSRLYLVEREPELAGLAGKNILVNGFSDRAFVVPGDLTLNALSPGAPKIVPDSIDHALANPPYHAIGRGTAAPNPLKSQSHAMTSDDLELWVRFLTRIVRPGGTATLIHKAALVGRLMTAFAGRFGGLLVLPIHSYATQPAIRVIVQGTKGSKAEPRVLPGLVLHRPDQSFRPLPKAIFRDGAALDLAQWPNSAHDCP